MTHLGQRLSALIDGELEGSERERVLLHMAKCSACRDEAAALRMLKRRMSALADAAGGVGAGLTGRLIGLSALASPPEERPQAGGPQPDRDWAQRPAGPAGHGQPSPEQRAGRYFLAGSIAVFLAGLGTAAFIAGGEPQPQAPTLPVTPSVDVMVFPHETSGGTGAGQPVVGPSSIQPRFRIVSPPASPHPSRSRI